ncbi:MAG TPA: hypothetical protein VEI94_07360 [Candidatus Bathyarchaeia archaeon]|nr:hypothetical protein [Candidatus Bathyarchaeia archaeon]
MLINSDHTPWLAATVIVTSAATASYVYYVEVTPYGPSGGSWPGIAYGIIGTSFMVIAGLLAARKKVRTWRLGSAQLWMKMHLWLGLLAVPFILFHSGFRLGGPLTLTLMVLFTVVTLSGIFGLVLQQFLPTMMTARVPLETLRSQIDYVAAGLAADAYELVASVVGPLAEASEEQARLAAEEEVQKARPANWKQIARQRPAATEPPDAGHLRELYLTEVRPYLNRRPLDPRSGPDFRQLMIIASDEWRGKVEKLVRICEESRQLGVQLRLHAWLHHWLFVHAPLSFTLFVLTAFHVVLALRY